MRQKLEELQTEIYKSTIVAGGLNTPLSEINRSSGQKISKDKVELISTINQLGIEDINRPFYSTKQDTSCSKTHIDFHQDRLHSRP